jgi:NCS1 family nucleobase:cation symporter-1
VQLVGWGSFEVIVMRDSADALAKQAFGFSMPLIWTVVFGLLATLLAISGPLSFVRRFLRTWGIWLLLAGAAWLSWNLLAKHDLAALMRRPGTGEMSFGGAIDLVVAMPLSWLPLISDYTRFGRRPGETFRGTLLGYGIANIWFYALGAIYGLAAGGGDALLTGALAQAGGGLALLLILIEKWTTRSPISIRLRSRPAHSGRAAVCRCCRRHSARCARRSPCLCRWRSIRTSCC